ncbi:MAG: NADH-quinone oxidoreductase subunit C [Chloroflexi bacterium]|nr:NADH-quinone oxidoreductase subunit C [Chloroflexota bacterium]
MEIPAARDPVQAARDAFGDAILHVKQFRGETTLVVATERLPELLGFFRASPGLVYNMLSDVSAVDYYPDDYGDAYDGVQSDYRPERYGVCYHILSMLYNRRLRIKAFAAAADPRLPAGTSIFPAANWLEREIADMMGIAFEDHPDPRRLLMPEDWHGHPHRRDYPLGKETVAFSFNIEDIHAHKPFAKD